ncbi:MAG: DUF1572 family protein [Acidobacteria bacterium]|nr:DUF1572 family protein [Acidobacteriota bacterium]
MELAPLFLDTARRRLRQYLDRIKACLERLDDQRIWERGSENENAIGNLVLHLAGNVRQWIVSGVGGQPDVRTRDREFSAHGDISRQELCQRLEAAVEQAAGVIDQLTAERLAERVTIQGYDVSVLEAVFHVVEHFAQHTGQIIYATKLLTHEDLGFYRHLNQAAAHGRHTP